LFAQLAHGASWLLLVWAGISGSVEVVDVVSIAWIHTLALGWATVAATSVLLHVIPGFTDAQWRFETQARLSIGVLAFGVVLFVAALLTYPQFAIVGAALIVCGLLAYCAAALATLWAAFRGERTERAIARALTITLLFMLLTALLGLALAALISGYHVPAWVSAVPATHANLGMLGWLSLLVFGVSARTVKPITGNKSRFSAAHIAVGSLTLLGVTLLAIGLSGVSLLIWPGAICFAVAATIYMLDLLDILRRATVSHRVPQAFLLAGVAWLACGLVIGAGVLSGRPWQLAYGFIVLAGWIGQMINAHIYHIGVRLLLTVYRGDEDETRPQEVLDARLSWASFWLFQLAIVSATVGLLVANPILATFGGLVGCAGWLAMITNLVCARTKAMRPRTISLL
ncbi:MAG: hypothetical protein M3Y21_05070, partial [Candidatus Eremiobacteraeota bacterium]|nr:hypothetical protein [Candidatus Eremiobacteraeota bacterium]